MLLTHLYRTRALAGPVPKAYYLGCHVTMQCMTQTLYQTQDPCSYSSTAYTSTSIAINQRTNRYSSNRGLLHHMVKSGEKH